MQQLSDATLPWPQTPLAISVIQAAPCPLFLPHWFLLHVPLCSFLEWLAPSPQGLWASPGPLLRPLPDQVSHPDICSGFYCCCHLQTPSAAEALLGQGWEPPIFSAQACGTVTTSLTLCCHPHQIC